MGRPGPPVLVIVAREQDYVAELRTVQKALEPLPALLDQEKWDAVRSVLKVRAEAATGGEQEGSTEFSLCGGEISGP